MSNITLINVPLYLGGRHQGVSMGPTAMKIAGLERSITTGGHQIVREVNIDVPSSTGWQESNNSTTRYVPEIAEVSLKVASAVEAALSDHTIPVTIGGDHSIAIGTIAGVANYYRKLGQSYGLIWMDAHGDIHTPDTTPSGNVHGMPFGVSLGLGDKRLTDLLGFAPKIPAKQASIVGIRDLEAAEQKTIRVSGVTPFTMNDIDRKGMGPVMELCLQAIGDDISGLHLSLDLDVIDPEVAPGVSVPAKGGLSWREIHLALELLADTQLVRSMDIVELNPALDVRNQTAQLAVELLLDLLGKKIL